jgi:hypothetical protein
MTENYGGLQVPVLGDTNVRPDDFIGLGVVFHFFAKVTATVD